MLTEYDVTVHLSNAEEFDAFNSLKKSRKKQELGAVGGMAAIDP